MPTAKKQYNRKTKKITLAEFRAWLEGVEELQPKSWVPDAAQWKLIRNKIKCIVEPEPEQGEPPVTSALEQMQRSPNTPLPPAPPARRRVPVPEPTPQPGGWESIGLGGPDVPRGPTGPSALDGLDSKPATPPPPGPPGKLPTSSVPLQSPDGTVTPGTKTPDIDTSDGTFESQFS